MLELAESVAVRVSLRDILFMECPTEFFVDCENAKRKCQKCAAITGRVSDSLHFKPKTLDHDSHPYLVSLKSREEMARLKSKLARTSFKAEDEAISRLQQGGLRHPVKATIASGAKNGDGDFTISSLGLRFDHKLRTQRASLGITTEELRKGRGQGIEAWFITNRAAKDESCAVVLTLEAFIALANKVD